MNGERFTGPIFVQPVWERSKHKGFTQWLQTILFRYFIHRLSVMECTWLIYVNVIDCAEVMMNRFCSTCYLFVCRWCFFSLSQPFRLSSVERIFITIKRLPYPLGYGGCHSLYWVYRSECICEKWACDCFSVSHL